MYQRYVCVYVSALYVCMNVKIYIYKSAVYVYIFICIMRYVCTYVYVYTYQRYVCVYVSALYVCMNVKIYIYKSAVYVYIFICIMRYVCTYVYVYTSIRTYAYTYLYSTCSLSHTHIREEQKRNIHAQYYNGTKNTHLHQHQTYNSMNTKYNTHMIPMK